MDTPLLEFSNISKAYGQVHANQNINFQIHKGQIHALIGENGAGKSTLMKILFGLEHADSGEIRLRGERLDAKSPIEAKKKGLGMVQQHFQLAPALTALDHVILEQPHSFLGSFFEKLNRDEWRQKLENLSEQFAMPLPWDQTVDQLSVGLQQRLEILKLLAFDADILILDEPTAVLTPQEVDAFLERLRSLRDSGKTIILITHKLREVIAVADWVTVLRQGKVAGTFAYEGQSPHSLASLMVGKAFSPQEFERKHSSNEILVRVQNLSCTSHGVRKLDRVNFEIRSGQILGVAGVHGNGQTELIKALIMPKESGLHFEGSIKYGEDDLLHLANKDIRKLEVGLIPEDRLQQAVIPALSAKENYLLGRHDFFKGRWIRRHRRDKELEESMEEFDVRPRNADLPFASFSGGNQQKIVVAREVNREPNLLVVAEPTRGVDIGAIEAIHASLIATRDAGVGVLLVSSELEELLRLSDRIIVMSKGQIKATLLREEFDVERIGCLMGGEA
ncbi:MAG: ABC transporter ATP-binding protein [Bdellovibrionaceae bacterium]|nr:ABC transporter ATP-binding protein [Pseudobdellovibrionaceae bacterium]